MEDAETLAQINGPEVRPPVLWPPWRTDFDVSLHMALLYQRLAMNLSERLAENERAVSFHHLIDRASPFCHFRDEALIQMFNRTKADF